MLFIFFTTFSFPSLCSVQFTYYKPYGPNSSFTLKQPSWLHGWCVSQEWKEKLWMQKACKIMQWQRLALTPKTLLSSSIVTRKLLWHFYRITTARGNILNSSPPAAQCDKQLQALLSCNIIQLNKYCITQGTLLHLEKHKDRKSAPQDKHGPETEDKKSLTEARPRGRHLTKMIPSAPALKSM